MGEKKISVTLTKRRIVLSEERLQKLYNDVVEVVLNERIVNLRGGRNWDNNKNYRDTNLAGLQDKVGAAAIQSIQEPVSKHLRRSCE